MSNGFGHKNSNWKGGISKDFYHYKKLQRRRYPERLRAREQARSAVESGQIEIKPCRVCGSAEVVQHHPDYSKPLDIVWLCADHHREVHDGMKFHTKKGE